LLSNYKEKVQFKTSHSSDFQTYSSKNLIGFKNSGGEFKSIQIPSSNQFLFKKILLKGKINLYEGENTSFSDVYYVEKDNQLYSLVREEEIDKNNKIKVIAHYMLPLKQLISDKPGFIYKVDKMSFKRASLYKLLKEYNIESGEDIKFKDSSQPFKFKFYAQLGINNKNFSPGSFKSANENKDLFYAPGLGLNIKYKENSMFSFGGQIANASFESTRFSSIVEQNLSFQYLFVQLPFRFQYAIGSSNIRPLLGIGMTANFEIKNDATISTIIPSGSTTNTINILDLAPTSILFSAGIEINRSWFVEVIYNSSVFQNASPSPIFLEDVIWSPIGLFITRMF